MADNEPYNRLSETAKAFISALEPQPVGSNNFDEAAIFALLDQEQFRLDWGHSFFISTMEHLQGEKTAEAFVQHLLGMGKALQTWKIDITNTCVDASNKSVVVRANFYMYPQNSGGDSVLNDIIFWMTMNQGGDKLVRCTEFVDPVASAELAKRMKASRGQ